MKTSVMEVRDMLSVLSVLGVEKRIEGRYAEKRGPGAGRAGRRRRSRCAEGAASNGQRGRQTAGNTAIDC